MLWEDALLFNDVKDVLVFVTRALKGGLVNHVDNTMTGIPSCLFIQAPWVVCAKRDH